MSVANNKVLPAGQVFILRCAQFESKYNITVPKGQYNCAAGAIQLDRFVILCYDLFV